MEGIAWLDEMRARTLCEIAGNEPEKHSFGFLDDDNFLPDWIGGESAAADFREAEKAAVPGITELTLAAANRPELMPALLAVVRGESVTPTHARTGRAHGAPSDEGRPWYRCRWGRDGARCCGRIRSPARAVFWG